MKKELLTAADFFEKLQHDKLDISLPFSIIGMVKKSEEKERTIEFAPGGKCSNWVTIPLEFIEDVEMIKTISCKDHSHPLVKLNMRTPETTEGKILFALLESIRHASENKQPNNDIPTSLQMSSIMNSSFAAQQSRRGLSHGPKMSSRIAARQGLGGFGGGGELSAWGCWWSQCCSYGHYECYDPNSDEATWGPICRWVCDAWEPCERCIWPW